MRFVFASTNDEYRRAIEFHFNRGKHTLSPPPITLDMDPEEATARMTGKLLRISPLPMSPVGRSTSTSDEQGNVRIYTYEMLNRFKTKKNVYWSAVAAFKLLQKFEDGGFDYVVIDPFGDLSSTPAIRKGSKQLYNAFVHVFCTPRPFQDLLPADVMECDITGSVSVY